MSGIISFKVDDVGIRRYSETDDYPTNYIISPFNKKKLKKGG